MGREDDDRKTRKELLFRLMARAKTVCNNNFYPGLILDDPDGPLIIDSTSAGMLAGCEDILTCKPFMGRRVKIGECFLPEDVVRNTPPYIWVFVIDPRLSKERGSGFKPDEQWFNDSQVRVIQQRLLQVGYVNSLATRSE
jgi:hypothetical protein